MTLASGGTLLLPTAQHALGSHPMHSGSRQQQQTGRSAPPPFHIPYLLLDCDIVYLRGVL